MAPDPIINKLLPNEIVGKDLFHYTSADGLLGILGNKVIRCSHIFYLNDIEENLNGWKYFFEVLESYSDEKKHLRNFTAETLDYFSDQNQLTDEQLSERVFENMHKNRIYSFIFSLSLIEDDLNQWRSYAEEPFGFSIHFRFEKDFWDEQEFFRNGKNCSILLRQCVYDPNEKREKIIQLLDFYSADLSREGEDWKNNLFSDMLTLSLFFKHEKFKAEKECRLVLTTALEHQKNKSGQEFSLLKIRQGKSYLIPFVELKNSASNIKAITIGPTPFKSLSFSSLKMLQNSLDETFGHIEIKHSEVPYRSW